MQRRIAADQICPCGTQLSYGECCWEKGFEWILNDDGEVVRAVPMTPEMLLALDEAEQGYIDVFGRPPRGTDPVLLGQYLYSDQEMTRETVDAMRRSGTRPEIIYAYENTGLIITESNIHTAPTQDIEEWESAVEEFFSRKNDLSPEESAWKNIRSELDRLIIAFGYVLEHGGAESSTPNIGYSKILTPEEYELICATRSFKTLRSIRYLLDKDIGADSLALARSVYESYLHIVFIRAEPEKLADLVDARYGLSVGTHEHPRAKGGVPDRRVIQCKQSGRKFESSISKYRMAASSADPVDLQIFSEMYEFLSEFTHPAFVTSYTVTNEAKSLDARVNEHQHEALMYAVFLGTLVLDQIRGNDLIRADAAIDIGVVVSRARDFLSRLISEFLSPDGSPQFDAIKNRLSRVGVLNDRRDV